jgi:hypothetical protein
MSKFLDLVNEFSRSVSVTPTELTGNLMGLFTKLCDTLQVNCEQTSDGLLIKIPAEEENQDISKYTSTTAIDSNVEGLASKANVASRLFGTTAGQAKTAVKDRANLAPQMVKAYQDITKQIKAALINMNKPSTTV